MQSIRSPSRLVFSAAPARSFAAPPFSAAAAAPFRPVDRFSAPPFQAAAAPLRPADRFSAVQPRSLGRPVLKAADVNTVVANANMVAASEAEADTRYFTCVWGKKSNRKHKKWEGDAYLKGWSDNLFLRYTSTTPFNKPNRSVGWAILP